MHLCERCAHERSRGLGLVQDQVQLDLIHVALALSGLNNHALDQLPGGAIRLL